MNTFRFWSLEIFSVCLLQQFGWVLYIQALYMTFFLVFIYIFFFSCFCKTKCTHIVVFFFFISVLIFVKAQWEVLLYFILPSL